MAQGIPHVLHTQPSGARSGLGREGPKSFGHRIGIQHGGQRQLRQGWDSRIWGSWVKGSEGCDCVSRGCTQALGQQCCAGLLVKPVSGQVGRKLLLLLIGQVALVPLWLGPAGNLAWEPCLGTCSSEPLGIFENLFLGTCGNLWQPVPGNIAWKPCLGTWLGNLAWERLPGNLAWERLPGNLGTLAIRILAAPTCSGTFTIDIATQTWLAGKSIICIDDYRCVFSVISYKPPFIGDFPAATFGHRLTSCSHQPRIIHHLYATL